MKNLQKGQDKVSQICQVLRSEALEPAKKEAQTIIDEARAQAEKIIHEANEQSDQLIAAARRKMEQERDVFQSSLIQASKQSLEALKQEIEHKLFNDELRSIIDKLTADPKVIAQIINAICTGIEKEGTAADLQAIIPKHVSPAAVNSLLLDGVLKRLQKESVEIGNIEGGAQVRFVHKRMTIDMSDHAIRELLAQYVRKDFRNLIFRPQS